LQNTGSGGGITINCEGVSLRGYAYAAGQARKTAFGNYFHDSNIVVSQAYSTGSVEFNLLVDAVTTGINIAATRDLIAIKNNTIYNCSTGISGADTERNIIINNIIDTCTTKGITFSAEAKSNYFDYNNYNGNTGGDTNNATKGANALALDPEFTDITVVTNTTATTSSAVMTQSGADFDAVTNEEDYLHITNGTDVTVGVYQVTAHTTDTLTLNPDPGDSATGDINFFIRTGHDFSIGTNLKAKGFPGVFPGSESTGYLDIGAVQREEAGEAGGITPGLFEGGFE